MALSPEGLNDNGAKKNEESWEDQRQDGHHLSPWGEKSAIIETCKRKSAAAQQSNNNNTFSLYVDCRTWSYNTAMMGMH